MVISCIAKAYHGQRVNQENNCRIFSCFHDLLLVGFIPNNGAFMAEKKTKHANIHDAILAVYKEVGYVQKTGVNQAQKYRYAGEADLIAALRPVMLEHGITVNPAGVNLLDYEGTVLTDAHGNQKKTNRIVGVYKFDFIHESGSILSAQVVGEGVDNGDKASYKAATGALKYALRQTFLIETGDEPEAHESPEVVGKNPATNGDKTAQAEFGTATEFKKYYNETMDAIKRLPGKDAAGVITKRIDRVAKVDDQCAINLNDALELRLDELHMQGI
jgi:hypothetical protein